MKTGIQHNLRIFYTLILTQTFSQIGSRISGLALGIWVYTDTGNATPLALVAFFSALPMIIASSVSGVLADRWDRRYVMALSDAGQALGTIFLLLSVLSGDFQLWHLYVVTFIQSVFGVFQFPAFQAAVTMLVPDAHRDRANAIQQMSGPVAGIIAPAIAALVYGAFGITGAILIDLFTFLAAVVVVLLVKIPRPEQTQEGAASRSSIWQEILGGLQFLLDRRPLLLNLLHISLVNFLIAGSMAVATPYILARTSSEATLGVLLSVLNLGGIAGAVIMGVWGGTRPRIHTIMIGIAVGSLFMALFGAAQSPLLMGFALFCFMLMPSIVNAAAMSLLQVKVPADMQGRVFALVGQFSMLLTPLSYLLVGPLVDQVFEPAVGQTGWAIFAPLVGNMPGAGMGLLFVITGLLTSAVTLLIYLLPSIRHMEAILPDYEPTAASSPQPVETDPGEEVALVEA